MEVFSGVKPDHAARSGAARASGALRRGCLADALDVKRGNTSPRRVRGHARESAIDHRGDSFYGYRTFRHIGRKNDLAAARGRDRAVLLRRGEITMQWEDEKAGAFG